MRGVMIDCSRNSVMRVEAVKRLVLLLEKMHFDTLLLYTEDTYEVDGEPLFGHLRGRYSKEEIREIDAFCISHGIELIPCIQTLAHLNAIFKWHEEYDRINDCNDILLVDEEDTYKLIDRMFSSLASCVTSRKINIGMDEAFMMTFGRYRKKHGIGNRLEIILRHLNKVCDIAKKCGWQPMVWADMICTLAAQSSNYYDHLTVEKAKSMKGLPKNVSLIYWDYAGTDYDRYTARIEKISAFGNPVVFAGGAWSWNGFTPDNQFSIDNTKVAVKACIDNGVDDMFLTMWGDDGGECSRFALLPTLAYTSGLYENKTAEQIKTDFYELTGMSYDDFMLLDLLNTPAKGDDLSSKLPHANKFTKLWLYNDPFMGMADYRVTGNENAHYKEIYNKLSAVKPTEDYKPLFDYATALADLLSVKTELGVKTRSAYKANDKNRLLKIAENDYTAVIDKLNTFHKVYQAFWFSENKPHGFDIQDVRLGGLLKRLESCKNRLIDYCGGKTDSIPELEEPVIAATRNAFWGEMVSPNVITHNM